MNAPRRNRRTPSRLLMLTPLAAAAVLATACEPATGSGVAFSTSTTAQARASGRASASAAQSLDVKSGGRQITTDASGDDHVELSIAGNQSGTGQQGLATAETALEGQPGDKVTVALHNGGQAACTLTVPGEHLEKVIPPGTTTLTLSYPASGKLRLVCRSG